ncbi:MAG: glycosyltransferase [Vicinamibacterales bacterium]
MRPEYFEDVDNGVVWQPDVYRLAAAVARHVGARRVIDVGCGRGRKLVALRPEFEILGVDYGANLDHCRAAHPDECWIEADLESAAPLPLSAAAAVGSVVVCADVLEHLVHPERLLDALRGVLESAACAVLTTPERVLTWGPEHTGPPPNAAHVQEWSLDEFRALVASRGLVVFYAGVTASDTTTWTKATALLVVSAEGSDPASRVGIADQVERALRRYDRERALGLELPEAASRPLLASAPNEPNARAATVSVVMRTRNRPELLVRAIRSVLSQSWTGWELVIVNDAGDVAIVEAAVRMVAGGDTRIRLIHRDESSGMEAATNAGVAAATGHYLTVLDDDDTWEPEFLEVCVQRLLTRPGPSVRGVVTRANRVTERLGPHGIDELERTPFTPNLQTVSLAQLTQRNLFPVNAFVYEREAQSVIGPYRDDLPVLGDWEFNLRFVRRFEIDVVPAALANVHVRPDVSTGAAANSSATQHQVYDAWLRNEWLRADLEAGRFGLGVLASLRALLVDHDEIRRHTEALQREREAVQRDGGRQRVEQAARWAAVHRTLLQAPIERLRRRRCGRVVVVGGGVVGELAAERLIAAGLMPVAVGDNDGAKHGEPRGALTVTSVDQALQVDADAVLVASVAHAAPLRRQVYRRLRRLGLRRTVVSPAA